MLHWWCLLPFSCFKLNDLSSYFLYQIVYREWDCEVINGKSSIFGVYQGMQLYGTLALLLARTQHIERDRLRDRTLSSKGRRPRVHRGSPSLFNVDIILKPVKSYLTKHSTCILIFIFFYFVETFYSFFCCLLAPTLTLCMVCESACLLVYVTEMYLHNRRRNTGGLFEK